MATTLRLRDHLLRSLQNATPGTTDPVLDSLGRQVNTGNVDYVGRALAATTWATATAYSAGDYAELSTGEVLLAKVGGTSHATIEPTATGYGDSITDNTVTWEQVTE